MNNIGFLPIPEDELPPFPSATETGPQVCAAVCFYLAILDDLASEQVEVLREHVRACSACAREEQRLQRVHRLIAGLPASQPSPRVDQAVLEAIAAATEPAHRDETRSRPISEAPLVGAVSGPIAASKRPTPAPRRGLRSRAAAVLGGLVAAAVLLFALFSGIHLWQGGAPSSQGFALPANLTWSGFVIYHSEVGVDARGVQYHINAYHDLGNGHMRVETIQAGSMDVVVVSDSHSVLGLDMTRHVAQLGANGWSIDDSMFDLAEIRSDLSVHQAVYLGKEPFHNQEVYLIRCKNGLVLLLDMRYMPVNVLRSTQGIGADEPMYETIELMPSAGVSNATWNMNVPPGFHMGTLPPRPADIT